MPTDGAPHLCRVGNSWWGCAGTMRHPVRVAIVAPAAGFLHGISTPRGVRSLRPVRVVIVPPEMRASPLTSFHNASVPAEVRVCSTKIIDGASMSLLFRPIGYLAADAVTTPAGQSPVSPRKPLATKRFPCPSASAITVGPTRDAVDNSVRQTVGNE